jgi:A/G-specific adenine glycosylase
MKDKEFQNFADTLLSWYRSYGRVGLPWRKKNPSPYEVWVSEIMLQQTQVSRVTDFYQKFLKRFPNVTSLARASWEEFLPYYEGLGYYRRGKNMLLAAKIIKNEYSGRFSKKRTELLKLPGVGEYTARAILAFAYNENFVALDTNIQRIFSRYFPEEENVRSVMERAEKFLETRDIAAREFNSALMDFGALVCTSSPPQAGHDCPFRKKCQCFKGVNQKNKASKKVSRRSPSNKRRQKFSRSETRSFVFLHEDHKKYFSKNKNTFKPFILPKGKIDRGEIKEYFLQTHGLTISVRPPSNDFYFQNERVLFVNAQILSGEHSFSVWPKEAVKDFQTGIEAKVEKQAKKVATKKTKDVK